MGKSARNGTDDEVGVAWKVWGPVALVALMGFVIAFQFVGPAPPSHLVLATGPEGGAYHHYGEGYRDLLATSGIGIELHPTAGSMENLRLLRSGAVDIAFVQGGTADARSGTAGELQLSGIASLYFEPLWVFHRSGQILRNLADLAGLRIQVGASGSGTNKLSRALLLANGVTPENSAFAELEPRPAVDALLAGDLDALLVVSGPQSETVQALMALEGDDLTLLDLDRDHSLAQVFRFLRPVLLSEGLIDLARNIPDHDVQLVAPTAMLVSADDLHPALVPLFIEAAQVLHGTGGLFEQQGQFPSLKSMEIAPLAAALNYFRSGPSLIYRVLPFRTAAMLDRLKVMLLPLLTLLLPLLKVAPPLYRWRIRSKIYRWYKLLHEVEAALYRTEPGADLTALEEELANMEREILEVRVPPSYGEEAYNLRMHLDLVQARLRERRTIAPPAPDA
jgi:TRAP transporter TAXI family solute receptor